MDWGWFVGSIVLWLILGSLPAFFVAHAFFGQFKEKAPDKKQES